MFGKTVSIHTDHRQIHILHITHCVSYIGLVKLRIMDSIDTNHYQTFVWIGPFCLNKKIYLTHPINHPQVLTFVALLISHHVHSNAGSQPFSCCIYHHCSEPLNMSYASVRACGGGIVSIPERYSWLYTITTQMNIQISRLIICPSTCQTFLYLCVWVSMEEYSIKW